MPLTKFQRKSLLVFSTVVLAAVPGVASPLFVSNYSFETLPAGGLNFGGCGAGCSYSQTAIPGWTLVGSGGQFQPGNPGNTTYFDTLSDGPTNAYNNTAGGIISQMIGASVVVGEVYTLQVDIGYRKDSGFTGSADLLINGQKYTAIGVATQGAFTTFTATYTGLLADVGQSITIELNSSGQQGNFDNVRLDGTAPVGGAPEPAALFMAGPALLGLAAWKRRR
uniref:PEP-CTERM protein-sorting domain-containing protein n=1 Tax=Solibacter usitatus (strain Ellin6076) TaxID=234267 RepID=Q028N4_SOLUE